MVYNSNFLNFYNSVLYEKVKREFLSDLNSFIFFQLLDSLDLKSSSGIDRVEKVFSKLNWNSFPGVQSLLLKVRLTIISIIIRFYIILSYYFILVIVQDLLLVTSTFFTQQFIYIFLAMKLSIKAKRFY